MAELPRINWGDTNWSDVEGYVREHPNQGFDWSGFWNNVLWFGEPPDKLYRDARGVLQDNVAAPIGRAGAAFADDLAAAGHDAIDAAAGGARQAAADTWQGVAPYVAVGGLVLLAYAVVRAR